MPVKLKLPAAALQIRKGDKTKQSPFAPGRQELTGFESVARFDLLDFHRFLLKETGLNEASASSEETGKIKASAHETWKG